jgi:CBS domain-containing protein
MRVARDLMNSNLITVPSTMDLVTLSRVFCERRISGAPVVDKDGVLVGVISQSDLIRTRVSEEDLVSLFFSPIGRRAFAEQMLEDEYGVSSSDNWWLNETSRCELLVCDVMNRCVYTIDENATLPEISQSMFERDVKRLLVTSGGRFAGIITASDLVRAWRTDQEESLEGVTPLRRDKRPPMKGSNGVGRFRCIRHLRKTA